MAEALFRQFAGARGDYEVCSAGISAIAGQPASSHTRDILREAGIDSGSHESRPLTASLVRRASHIFAMTQNHRDAIEMLFPEAADKTYLALEFCPDDSLRGADIPDPIGLGRFAYEETRAALESAIPSLFNFIEQTSHPNPMTTSTAESSTLPADTSATPPAKPRLVIGCDHGGLDLKTAVVAHLEESGYPVDDIGTHSADSVDYPDFSHRVARGVLDRSHDLGILVCTSGIGVSIAANRHPGIRASVVHWPEEATTTRLHNHSNVLCLSQTWTSPEDAKKIVDAWLAAEPEPGRHARRVGKIEDGAIRATDPEVADAIAAEVARQSNNIELIASENFASAAVRAAQGSVLTNKYAEGYPGRRWYGGCENVDVIEQLAIDRSKELFEADHANVQPHSGSQANAAVYFSVLQPGDKILTMDLSHGGHLTHGHPANFSGKFYEVAHYGVDKETETIDYDHLAGLAREVQPKMITAGASAYPRTIDFARMAEIAKSVGAYLFVDMAHIAGLVATGVHPSPVPHADFVTTTTHKSLRGPRGGLILCRQEHAKKIDAMVFPGIQGGPLMHVIAAKAVCLKEALQPSFKAYQQAVVSNASSLAAALIGHGFKVFSGGTDNHLMLVDLRPMGLNGKVAQEALDQAGITVNKNSIPFDTESPFKGGGIRIGTPAVTTRGMGAPEMDRIAAWIRTALGAPDDSDALAQIRSEVAALNTHFPLP
ncbi:hypothetical protein BH23VER1_BH23VER1_12330 [soil metagenome]